MVCIVFVMEEPSVSLNNRNICIYILVSYVFLIYAYKLLKMYSAHNL